MATPEIGAGCSQPKWILHIANRPELEVFQHQIYRPLATAEAAQVIQQTSNHWRKVFSIMAKISFALFDTGCDTWQQYRDTKLLSDEGFEAISFEPVSVEQIDTLTIVCGFTYAQQQLNLDSLVPFLQQEKLLVHENKHLVVTPYFDWRQLNNRILADLISLLSGLLKK